MTRTGSIICVGRYMYTDVTTDPIIEVTPWEGDAAPVPGLQVGRYVRTGPRRVLGLLEYEHE